MITQMYIGKLKELFPEYVDEIDELSGKTACGCSMCTWMLLKREHPELELPDEVSDFAIWGY